MYLTPYTNLHSRLIKWSKYLIVTVLVISILVLVGWALNIPFLKHPLPGEIAMNPTTACAFIFAAISFLLLTGTKRNKQMTRTGYGLAGFVFIIGVLKITGLVFNIDLGIDHILFEGKLVTELYKNVPNRMAPNTAIGLILLGSSLCLLRTETPNKRFPAHYLTLVLALSGLLSLVGYIYGVRAFYGMFTYIPMAIHTAICFLFISMAIFFVTPGKGIMREITSTATGSITARLLIPAAVTFPIILGLLRLYGHKAGFFTPEFGVAILVLSIIVVFLGLIWHNARLLNYRDWEKTAAERALKESEEQVTTIFNAAPDAVVVIDEDGNIVKWNPKSEELFEWREEEVIGQPLSNVIVPHRYREAHAKGLQHFIKTGESSILNKTIEIKALRKNNSEVDVSLRIAPTMIRDKYFFVGFIRDNTERNLLQEQLKQFNEELEEKVRVKAAELTDIFERITDGFIALDKNFQYTYVNKRTGEMTGRDPAKLIGKNVWEEFPDAIGSSTYKAFVKAMEEQHYINNIDYYEPMDLWQENHIYPSPEGISIFIRDITAQKRATELIEKEKDFSDSIINSLPGIFYMFDSTGKMLRWNENFETVSGYETDEVARMHPTEFFADEDKEYIGSRIMEVFTKGVSDAETSFFTKDKRKIPYYFTGKLIMMDGEPRLIGSGIDITGKIRAEEDLKKSYEQLRALASHLQKIREEERATIAREIHDEIGQQLTGLKMDMVWIDNKTSGTDSDVKKRIKDSLELIDATVKMIRRIATDLRPSILDDLGLVAAMEWHSGEFQKRSGIATNFASSLDEQRIPAEIATGIFRIYQESLTNVARHANAGKITASLDLDNGLLELEIKDDGKGFSVHEIGSKKTLGLLGMKERTSIMGGSYEIKSEPGKGTCVHVSVPLQQSFKPTQS